MVVVPHQLNLNDGMAAVPLLTKLLSEQELVMMQPSKQFDRVLLHTTLLILNITLQGTMQQWDNLHVK